MTINPVKMRAPYILPILVAFIITNSSRVCAQSNGLDSAWRVSTSSGDTLVNFIDLPDHIETPARLHMPVVSKQPEYPGGKIAWQNYLRSEINIGVPLLNKAPVGTYQVLVGFTVDIDGKLQGVIPKTNKGYGMEAEVVRAMRKSNSWLPAESPGGKKVVFTKPMHTMVIFNVKRNDVQIVFPQEKN